MGGGKNPLRDSILLQCWACSESGLYLNIGNHFAFKAKCSPDFPKTLNRAVSAIFLKVCVFVFVNYPGGYSETRSMLHPYTQARRLYASIKLHVLFKKKLLKGKKGSNRRGDFLCKHSVLMSKRACWGNPRPQMPPSGGRKLGNFSVKLPSNYINLALCKYDRKSTAFDEFAKSSFQFIYHASDLINLPNWLNFIFY